MTDGMNAQEQVIFNRIAGYEVSEVRAVNGVRRDGTGIENMTGTEVVVVRGADEFDFYFPDYADMSDAEMAEVVANNLKEELWNSLNASTRL